MTEIQSLFRQLPFKVVLQIALISVILSACKPAFITHDDRVKKAMRDINYADGISKLEATTIANAYLILYGKYKGRALFARISDGEDLWAGKVYVAKSLASPVDVDLPPIVINKSSGKIHWKHGPALDRIDLEALDNAEPSVAVY